MLCRRPVSPLFLSRLCAFLIAAAAVPAQAQRIVLEATNPGPITGTGRDLSFDLSAVTGEIRAARLEMQINYSNAGELDFALVDGSGAVQLPLSPVGGVSSSANIGMAGRYVISDSAVTTWGISSVGRPLVPATAVRAYQFGNQGLCLNLLARYLEFDSNRAAPLTLRVGRTVSANPGSGAIVNAQLVIDTDRSAEIFASGLEEPATPIPRCTPPALNVVLNDQIESMSRSTLTVVNSSGNAAPLRWYVRDFINPDVGPIEFGLGSNPVYVGRFGGRSRLNIGFWDASTGTVNFTTGAGARSIALAGDWTITPHRVVPGDYDGDGTTDVAVAFLDGQSRWLVRIRFSSNDALRDLLVDPRLLAGAGFSSANIGFGAGQDTDRNGVDEITLYAEATGGVMRQVQYVVEDQGLASALVAAAWGELGDRMVLGRWTNNSAGNQLGLMVARPRGVEANIRWFLFPNSTPTQWGSEVTDQPMSFQLDGDVLNDIAVYRPGDRRVYVIDSSSGQTLTLEPLGATTGFNAALGAIQGTIAPLPQ